MDYTKGTFKDGHTAWKVYPFYGGMYEIRSSDEGAIIAEKIHGEVNARLIASAPMMYEALKEIAEYREKQAGMYESDKIKQAYSNLETITRHAASVIKDLK
jgi:hypothetical protein